MTEFAHCICTCHHSGQSCVGAKRILVHESKYDELCAALTAAVEALKVGDPLQDDTEVGPMARADLRDQLHAQVVRMNVCYVSMCLF